MSMSSPSGKARVVHMGAEVGGSEFNMIHETPVGKVPERQRQNAVSNPEVRSKETQASNAENTPLLSKTAVSAGGIALNNFSRPVISDGQAASAAEPLKQPNLILFNKLLKMTDREKITQALRGFDINRPMENKITMLEHALVAKAVSLGSTTFVQTLIEMGARFDLIIQDCPRVLQAAIEIDNLDLVKFLISHSEGKNREEMHKALAYAVMQCEPDLALAIIKSLGKIDSSLVDVPYIFAKAAVLNNLELMEQIFFLAKPDINAPDMVNGYTALAYASGFAASNVIEFLLSNGAKVNGTDEQLSNNAVATALIGLSKRTLSSLSDEEMMHYRHRKLEALQTILGAKNVSIDFDVKIPEGMYTTRYNTLFDLAAKAGPEFVTCLAEAQLRQAFRRTGVPFSAEGLKY